MTNIFIVGAGQLGSRHLQGAMLSALPLKITVIDPSTESLELARTRSQQVVLGNEGTVIEFKQDLLAGSAVDICIIATTANIRFKVFKNLIEQCDVRNIIFEKVLFQKESEYLQVEALLKSYKIKAWVNCPRRIFPCYQSIKSLLADETNINMTLTGSSWGLACNGIHFVDLFVYLTGDSEVEVDGSLLSKKPFPSKRMGFYEVNGILRGCDASGNVFELQCVEDEEVLIEVRFECPSTEVLVKETEGKVVIVKDNEEQITSFKPLFQSELTHINIEEIVEHDYSSLTTFNESAKIHIPFINIMKQHLEHTLNKQFDGCPIT